jgi:hypothetical protein
MKQVLNIFGIIKGGRGAGRLRSLLLVARFAGIYSFPNAEFSEIRKTDLEFSYGLR